MKSKSNIISDTETEQDKLLGKILSRSISLFLFLPFYRMEMKRVRSNLSARVSPNQSAVLCKCTHCANSPLDSRFAACGLRLTISNIANYEIYCFDNRTISVSCTKKLNRSAIERFIVSSLIFLVLSIIPEKHRLLFSHSARKALQKKICKIHSERKNCLLLTRWIFAK